MDALLEARQSGQRTFSRAVVLRRYHHRMGLWENVVYRWRLLRVRCCLVQLASAAGNANQLSHVT